jgi:hypothetical protein
MAARQQHWHRGMRAAGPLALASTASWREGEVGKSVDEEEAEAELKWFEDLQAYARGRGTGGDAFFQAMVEAPSWLAFATRCENEWVSARVEGGADRARVGMKLEGLLEALKEYAEAHALFTRVLAPEANGCDGLFLERVRLDAFGAAQLALGEKKEAYVEAHVRFWSDLAAVLKSQEDVPLGELPRLGQAAGLPQPYGQAEGDALALLPTPGLLAWDRRDELGGGVEEQVAALLLFRTLALPALERLKREGSRENLLAYASALGRLWRKAGRWFGEDVESRAFLDELFASTKGRVATNDDPNRTGIATPGVFQVQRGGIEDAWLE